MGRVETLGDGEVWVSTHNRNFTAVARGSESKVCLTSAYSTAMAALEGRVGHGTDEVRECWAVKTSQRRALGDTNVLKICDADGVLPIIGRKQSAPDEPPVAHPRRLATAVDAGRAYRDHRLWSAAPTL